MENKNIITLCSCKPSQKKQYWGSWKFTGSYEKKSRGTGLTSRYNIKRYKGK